MRFFLFLFLKGFVFLNKNELLNMIVMMYIFIFLHSCAGAVVTCLKCKCFQMHTPIYLPRQNTLAVYRKEMSYIRDYGFIWIHICTVY